MATTHHLGNPPDRRSSLGGAGPLVRAHVADQHGRPSDEDGRTRRAARHRCRRARRATRSPTPGPGPRPARDAGPGRGRHAARRRPARRRPRQRPARTQPAGPGRRGPEARHHLAPGPGLEHHAMPGRCDARLDEHHHEHGGADGCRHHPVATPDDPPARGITDDRTSAQGSQRLRGGIHEYPEQRHGSDQCKGGAQRLVGPDEANRPRSACASLTEDHSATTRRTPLRSSSPSDLAPVTVVTTTSPGPAPPGAGVARGEEVLVRRGSIAANHLEERRARQPIGDQHGTGRGQRAQRRRAGRLEASRPIARPPSRVPPRRKPADGRRPDRPGRAVGSPS